MSERFYITTPIYYVNDVPHIGHAYTTIAADTIARWHRLNGRDVRFLTGTDEHGQKVMRAAAKLGRTPQEHCDLTVRRFVDLWTRLDIQYDDFIRTTESRHKEVVRGFLQQLWDQREIYSAPYTGWYSTSAERFWTDEEVAAAAEGTVEELKAGKLTPVCPDSGAPVELLTELNYFFRMSAYQDRLVRWIEEHPGCVQPAHRRNEVLGFLRKPLGDLCISRPAARLSWGIPLPFDEDYVTYVWFDALTNYVSALGPERARYWPADAHLVGKDILTFHTVYWFSMLLALGLEPPRQVYAHGWWLMNRAKMSKSVGNVVNPSVLLDDFGPDAVRYFMLREIPFGYDGEYSDAAFLLRINSDLVNDFSNLVHRVSKWAATPLGPAAGFTAGDEALLDVARRATATFRTEIEGLQFRQALEGLWELVRATNKYVDSEAPWALAKACNSARLATVLRVVQEVQRMVASHLWCVCPRSCTEVLSRLGLATPDLRVCLDVLPEGNAARAGDPLFMRREAKTPPPEPEPPAIKEVPMSDTITYEDFSRVALRVGLVVSAEKHPNADRLLVLQVDVGETEPRQIVAGIAKHYAPEVLVGKRIVVVTNLAPAMLRGVESRGMLLAAGGADIASLLSPLHEVAPGSIVR
ncbi:MAG: methionine--tRNA ligase [Deltaproteobacteria bacterium]|nr:methionine--tRNA ligase [Deltaproteobacteria bacterium]